MRISVIIPTYNEEGVIVDCLHSLGRQTVSDFEVVVVDDGSNDKTWELLSELKIKNLKFKIMRSAHLGAGAARNAGAKLSKGEILVFVDADMTFEKNFLKNLIKPIIANPPSQGFGRTRGTFSKEEYVSNWDNIWARCWNINQGWEIRRRHPKRFPDHQPVFRAILKSEFDKVGGFTPGGYDDDWSLSKKLGYEAVNAQGAIFYHKNPDNLIEVFDHAKWVAKRKYKLGVVGYLVSLVRSSLPASLVVGIYKSFRFSILSFTLFKIVYDFGIFVGILDYIFRGRASK